MSDLTPEEQALLDAAEEKPRRGRPRKAVEEPAPEAPAARGPHSPVQFDDDGWGDTPVQMRG